MLSVSTNSKSINLIIKWTKTRNLYFVWHVFAIWIAFATISTSTTFTRSNPTHNIVLITRGVEPVIVILLLTVFLLTFNGVQYFENCLTAPIGTPKKLNTS